MKKVIGLMLASAFLATATGCTSYAGAAGMGDKVVIASNNGFLGGIFRKVYVCKVTDNGLSACGHNQSP
jgi:hypothetical protein